MDSVRFGRALGIGTRLAARTAAKTFVNALDAATAPNPSAAGPARPQPTSGPPAPVGRQTATPTRAQTATQTAARSVTEARRSTRGLAQGSRRFGQAVWDPVAKLSGVLWLEVTGLFFGLFALSAALGAWKLRGNLHRTPVNAEANTHLLLALAVALVFGYFCLSSFIRASRRAGTTAGLREPRS